MTILISVFIYLIRIPSIDSSTIFQDLNFKQFPKETKTCEWFLSEKFNDLLERNTTTITWIA